MSDVYRYNEIFEYLREPSLPGEAHGNFVFGRADSLLARKMGDMYVEGLAKYFLVTGGVGKDSGELKVPEAEYVGSLAEEEGVPSSEIYLEKKASNGGENVRLGLEVIRSHDLEHGVLTAIAHATSLKRLAATLSFEAGEEVGQVYRVPTEYAFDPKNPVDQNEASAELLRLADWPAKNWLAPQSDLPVDLVDFAREVTSSPSQPPKA